MKAVNFVGFSGSGKTTLIEQLVKIFSEKGYKVGAIKDAHHKVDTDVPGKDTYRFRTAGAEKVILRTPERWALMVETREKPKLEELLKEMLDCDIVLIEGFKSEAAPALRLEVRREEVSPGKFIFHGDPSITAVVTEPEGEANIPLPVLNLNNPPEVALWLENKLFARKEKQ